MAMRILATWMVLYFSYLWKDISCNVMRNLEQGVPAVNRWIDCELEQPQQLHHHSNSQPTFHNYGDEIAAIFYTTVAPPVIHTRVRQIQGPYVYSVHQMIEFNRRQELKNYYENYYNNNYHKSVYTTRHTELLTRPAEPLTASLYITHKIEMPPKTSHATHIIEDLSNNQVSTENVIFEVTDPIPQTQKISTKKPSSIISLPTNMNTVSSLPSQLLELFHNISHYHKAQNSLANIEKEESTSIGTSQNENLFEVPETTERSSWDQVTLSLDPRIINSSLPQFPDSSTSIAFATKATWKPSYQSSATDHQLVNAGDEELNDRFGESVTVKNDNMSSAYNKEFPIIKFSNTNTSSEFVNNIDAHNRIDNTLAFIHNESFSEEEKEQIRKKIYLNKEMKISDHNDEIDIKLGNTSDIKYTAATNEDFSDNIVTTRTYRDIFPTTEITRFTIVDTYITSETELKITTLKSENRKIDISHPNVDIDNVKSSVDLQELDNNIDTFVNESTTTINLEEREDTKFSPIESTTVMSLEVTTRMPTNRNNSSSKNDDDFKMQTPNYNEILTTTEKSANFIKKVNSYNINTIDNNITVIVVNDDAEQLDEKRSYNNVDEFEVFTESQNVLNTLEPLHIISTTMKSNNVFGMHYGAKEDETILVTEEYLPSVTYFDVEPVEELIEISTVFSSFTSTYADDDAENRDNPDDNLTDELVIPLAKVSQKILFNDIEERTLPTNRITDSVTEIGAVSLKASGSQSTNTYIPKDDNYNTENDIGKGLNEIPKYIKVEAVTSKRKVITAPEPADNFISIPSSGLGLNEDNIEKKNIDMNIEHRVTESFTPDEHVTETSIKDVSITPIPYPYINGPGHRRTEKMLQNVVQMPQYNNNELVYESEKDASISQSMINLLPNAPAIANSETYYKNEEVNQIVDLKKIDPEYIYVGEESLTQREYGPTFSDTNERNNITTSTLTNAIDYETETDSIPSDLGKFSESERTNIETQEDSGAFIDAISKKVTSGTYDEVHNDIYVNVDHNNLTETWKKPAENTESSIDHDMYEVFLRKNLTAGAKIMK